MSIRMAILMAAGWAAWSGLASECRADGGGDLSGNGYVNVEDYVGLVGCLAGPNIHPVECAPDADLDGDKDVDLSDVARFALWMGHAAIPLRDTYGNVITATSTAPYSGRQTCAGSCHAHDIDGITNGFKFQQGRTNADGDVVMRDDFFDNGRVFDRSDGMFGRWRPAAPDGTWISPKHNDGPSTMDKTTFWWAGFCEACHIGGGPVEFDQDGYKLWDPVTEQFGYEAAGLDSEDVRFDRDYAYLDPANGTVSPARWDVTGILEPDCLFCHRAQRTIASNGVNMNWVWRTATLRARTNLVDNAGHTVAAYAAAATAGQGWFSRIDLVTPAPALPLATKLQIDYGVGVADGSLQSADDGGLALTRQSLAAPPTDQACWWCHDRRKRGEPWFTADNVLYAKFNKLLDDDPTNDVPAAKSKSCNLCHPGGLHHNFAKGTGPDLQLHNQLDMVNFRTCRECHLETLSNGKSNPDHHPDAPPFPGEALAHISGPMLDVLACQTCHVPFGDIAANVHFDNAVTGNQIAYLSSSFLSADPFNPADPDKSRWYPALEWRRDTDGVMRLFPFSLMLSTWWGDWDDKGTPADYTDDVIHPIALWRVRQVTQGQALPGVTDDNGDGKLEVNRPSEMRPYLEGLLANDSYGVPIAQRPVLVKGRYIWFLDAGAEDGVASLKHTDVGLRVDWVLPYPLSHYVRRANEAWGAGDHEHNTCSNCHGSSPVFDRLILVDPYGPDGSPIYETVTAMTGIDPQ